MPPKEELGEEINEVLDTSIEWRELNQDDVELLHELVTSGALLEPLAKQVAKEEGKEKVEELVDDYYIGKYISKVLL